MRNILLMITAILFLAFRPASANDFIYGVNIPWVDYAKDLAPQAEHPDWGDAAYPKNATRWEDLFGNMEEHGLTVCRHWMFERLEGIDIDKRGYMTGIKPIFFENMDRLIRQAKKHNVKLYLTFLNDFVEIDAPSPINNSRQRTAYLNNVLRPVVRRYKGENTIVAFDIFNEIESQMQRPVSEIGPDKTTPEKARAFIRACASAIHREDPDRKCSAGSGYARFDSKKGWSQARNGFYQGLGLDFYDFHLYTEDGQLPHVNVNFGGRRPDKPVVIGEFSTSRKRASDDYYTKTLIGVMRQAKSKGYAGVLLWSYNPYEKEHSLFRHGGSGKTDASWHRPVMSEIRKLTSR